MNRKSLSDAAGSVLSRWRETIADRFSKPPFSAPSQPAAITAKPRIALTGEELQSLNENQFQELVTGFFGAVGFRCASHASNAAEGVNLYLFHAGEDHAFGLVQWKWRTAEIGVDAVQQLQAMLTRESLAEGYIVATGSFTPEARAYDTGRKIMLLDGGEFAVRVNRLLPQNRAPLLAALRKPTETAQSGQPS